jgi:hypothetical protein
LYLGAKLGNSNEKTKYSAKKMKEKVVGIDLGTGSLGILLTKIEEYDE